jgi:hypothetical protein
MEQRLLLPEPPLSRFVELVWYYRNDPRPHQKKRLMPDGCMSLVINLAENKARIYDAENTNKLQTFSGSSLSGPRTKCFAIDTDEQTCVVGVSFRPAGAVPFFKMPGDELQNEQPGLQDLWGRRANELRGRVLANEGSEFEERFRSARL